MNAETSPIPNSSSAALCRPSPKQARAIASLLNALLRGRWRARARGADHDAQRSRSWSWSWSRSVVAVAVAVVVAVGPDKTWVTTAGTARGDSAATVARFSSNVDRLEWKNNTHHRIRSLEAPAAHARHLHHAVRRTGGSRGSGTVPAQSPRAAPAPAPEPKPTTIHEPPPKKKVTHHRRRPWDLLATIATTRSGVPSKQVQGCLDLPVRLVAPGGNHEPEAVGIDAA